MLQILWEIPKDYLLEALIAFWGRYFKPLAFFI
jgi:hypothetical protein